MIIGYILLRLCVKRDHLSRFIFVICQAVCLQMIHTDWAERCKVFDIRFILIIEKDNKNLSQHYHSFPSLCEILKYESKSIIIQENVYVICKKAATFSFWMQ